MHKQSQNWSEVQYPLVPFYVLYLDSIFSPTKKTLIHNVSQQNYIGLKYTLVCISHNDSLQENLFFLLFILSRD